MRKRNHVERMSRSLDTKSAAYHFFQFRAVDELHDGQPAYRNNETWSQNLDFIIHPGRAVANLARSRNTVCAARIFAGKTTADRREINFRSNCGFVHSAEFFEPTEKCLASSVRKRPLQNRFPRPWGLTDDRYIAHDCAAGDWRGFHARAATAAQQRRHMLIESNLDSFCSHGPAGRSHMARQRARFTRAAGPWLQRSRHQGYGNCLAAEDR